MLVVYGEELLAPHPTPKLEDHSLSAICAVIQYIHSYPLYLEAIPNLQTGHAIMIGPM